MNDGDDGDSGRHRSMVCDARTAADLARALLRRQVLRPTLTSTFLVLGSVTWTLIAADAGLIGGGPIGGALAAVVLAGLFITLTYRRTLRGTRTLYPEGATVSVDLAEDALTVRNAVAEQQVPYSTFSAPQVVAGHVMIPLRTARVTVPFPPGLLTAADVAWLRDRIARAESQEPVETPPPGTRPKLTARAVAGTGDDVLDDTRDGDVGGEMVVTEAWVTRASREVLRARLLGPGGIAVLLVALGVWLIVDGLTDSRVVCAALSAVAAGGFLVFAEARIRRMMRRTSGVGHTVRTRFDDTHLHLDSVRGTSSLAYAGVRFCVVRRHVVLLTMVTGLLQVLPREVVPDEGVRRLRSAGTTARSGAD